MSIPLLAGISACGNYVAPTDAPNDSDFTPDAAALLDAITVDVDAAPPDCPDASIRCGETCVPINGGTPEACGATCARCDVPRNGVAVCFAGTCSAQCNAGYELVDRECLPLPPALLSPLSSWTINEANPEFRASPHPDYTRYEIEICRDRACAQRLRQWSSIASFSRPPIEPPPNVQIYWRAAGVMADGRRRTSPIVPFRTTRRQTRGVDSVIFDFDGDGFADTVTVDSLRAEGLVADPHWPTVLFGSASLASFAPRPLVLASMPPALANTAAGAVQLIGDFDGDGFSDVVGVGGHVQVFFGSDRARSDTRTSFEGGRVAHISAHPLPFNPVLHAVAALGDVNEDGLADFVVAEWEPTTRTQQLRVYLGNREGRVRAAYTHLGSEAYQLVRMQCPGALLSSTFIVTLSRNVVGSTFLARAFRVTATSIEQTLGDVAIPFEGPVLEEVGDIDGDGNSEATVRSANLRPTALVLRMCGAPLSARTISIPSSVISIARTTDLDGDGTHELIFARQATPDNDEFVVAYHGGPTVLSDRIASYRLSTPYAAMPWLELDSRWLDRGLGSPGDMNGDGFDDFAVGTGNVRSPESTAPILFFTGGDLATWPRVPTELSGTLGLHGRYIARRFRSRSTRALCRAL